MKRLCALILATTIFAPVYAQFYSPDKIQNPGAGQRVVQSRGSAIRVDQKLNDSVPLDLKFKDEDGKDVTLRDYFSGKPVIVIPVFYTCAGVCSIELNNMVDSLRGFRNDSVGKDFDVIVFSIKPTEGPELAKAKKASITDIYNRRDTEDGWHFLTGKQDQIEKFADALGFRYEYDPADDTVVHPAAAIILTPQGQISKYFLETEYQQLPLLDSLKEAKKGRVGTKVQADSFWNCVQVDPITGQRSLNIMKALNIAAVFTLAVLAFSVVYMSVKYKVKASAKEGDAE